MAAAQGRRSLRVAAAIALDAAQLPITRDARARCLSRFRSSARFGDYPRLRSMAVHERMPERTACAPPDPRLPPRSSSSTTHPPIGPSSCWPHAAACAPCVWNAMPASHRRAMPAPRRRAANTCIFSTTTRSSTEGWEAPLLVEFCAKTKRRCRRIATARSGRTNLRSRRRRSGATDKDGTTVAATLRATGAIAARATWTMDRPPASWSKPNRSGAPADSILRSVPAYYEDVDLCFRLRVAGRPGRLSAALDRRSCRRRDLRKQRARRGSRGTGRSRETLRATLVGGAARASRAGRAQRRGGLATPRQSAPCSWSTSTCRSPTGMPVLAASPFWSTCCASAAGE